MPLLLAFPNLAGTHHRMTSPVDSTYNCIGWAAEDATRWWWPDATSPAYWPPGVPRVESVDAFRLANATPGFVPVVTVSSQQSSERVAIFAKGGTPTHACRQLPNGYWTSKLGESEDIEHELDALAGDIDGEVVLIMERSRA